MGEKSEKVLDSFLCRAEIYNMKCNTGKWKEVCFVKKSLNRAFPPVHGVEHVKERTLLDHVL